MRLIVLCSILLILIVKIDRTTSEIHSSMDQLIQLAKSEAQVIEYLRSLLSIQFAKLRDADKILEEFESIAEASNRDPKKFMGNPVNSFLMIKALTIDLNMFFQILNNTQELSATWHQIHHENLLIPTEKDYKETAVALNRIEDTYVLSPEEITKGVFGKSHSIRHLNAFECFELGKISQEKENHYHAIRWFNEALKLIQIEGENRTVNEMLVSGHLTYSIFKQGNVYQAINEAKRLLKIEPDNKQLKTDLDHYKRRLSDLIVKKLDKNSDLKEIKFDDLLVEKKNVRRGLSDERKEYESLCRESKDEIYDSSLKCRYINHHPLLRIAPVKQEQVSSDPPIFVFYDVITEYQTEQMIEFSKSKLERATVVGENSTDKISNQRTSQHGWLEDWDLPFLGYLNDLVSAVTNLSLETAEKWQMNNYGLGGHYDVHFDNFQDDSWSVQEVGDRIATWMYYIEAPEMGGATVFPNIGARVSPVNRSAVFWYNLEPSGQSNVRAKHAACPVVVGSKWVANKWIRSHGQIFRRPCDLTQEVYSIRKDSPSQNNATDSNVLDSVLNSVVGSFVNQIIQSYA